MDMFIRYPQHKLVHGLLTLALMMQAFIPLGFMPSQEGKIAVVICTASGPSTVMLDADDTPVTPHAKKAPGCAYAAVIAMATPPATPMFAAPVYAATVSSHVLISAAQEADRKSWLAQGPPSFA